MINIYTPSLGSEELEAVKQVFDSKWIGRGPITDKLINMLAARLISDTFDGCSSSSVSPNQLSLLTCATEAMFQIVDKLDLQPNDEVILPSNSFIGIINAIAYKKATPVFCDVEYRSLNTNLHYISKKITKNTKAIVLLHYAGRPISDVYDIISFCNNKGIVVIEDNANSPFSFHTGRSTGVLADFGIWSFDAMKIMTMGDGGLLYCKNIQDQKHISLSSYLGLKTESGYTNKIDNKWWQFDIEMPGRRSIVNDIASAIGIEQLKKVNSFINTRKQIHEQYTKFLLTEMPSILPPPEFDANVTSSYYMYHIQLESERLRDSLSLFLKQNQIYTTFRYYPLHLVEYYKKLLNPHYLINTEYATLRTLCLPLHQSLTDNNLDHIFETLKKFKNEHNL